MFERKDPGFRRHAGRTIDHLGLWCFVMACERISKYIYSLGPQQSSKYESLERKCYINRSFIMERCVVLKAFLYRLIEYRVIVASSLRSAPAGRNLSSDTWLKNHQGMKQTCSSMATEGEKSKDLDGVRKIFRVLLKQRIP